MVLDAIGSRDAKAKNLSAGEPYRRHVSKRAGKFVFFHQLYKNKREIPTRRIKGKASAV